MQVKKIKYLLLSAVVAAVTLLTWYFSYWIKTPQYTLGLIGTATEKHDFATFAKHVDLETLYGNAYDDSIVASFGSERLASPILAALVKNIKGVAVPILIDQTRNYVNGGTMDEQDPSDADSPMLQNNGVDVVNNLKNKTGVNSMRYQGIENVEKDGTNAFVTIKVLDKELDKHFLVKLLLRQLPDGSWQLLKIDNLQDLIAEREQVLQNKLAQLNEPIQEQLDAAVTIQPQEIQITSVTYSGVIRLLEADLQLTNTTAKEVQYFAGLIELYSPTNELFYSGNFASNKVLAPQQSAVYKFNWELNPYLMDDAKVMHSDLKNMNCKTTLSNIVFADGSNLELLTQLPVQEKK